MRKKIAEHMVLSAHTSPHVLLGVRSEFPPRRRAPRARKRRSTRRPAPSSRSPRSSPRRRSTRCGVPDRQRLASTATTSSTRRTSTSASRSRSTTGLIVPVIRNADEKNLLGLSRAINDLADAGARQEAEARGSAGRHVHDHQPGRVRRAVRHADHQPAAGRDPRASARSRSARSSSTMRSPSGRCATSRSATTTAWSTAPTRAGSSASQGPHRELRRRLGLSRVGDPCAASAT